MPCSPVPQYGYRDFSLYWLFIARYIRPLGVIVPCSPDAVENRYAGFPKQYGKMFKGSEVRTVTDGKGNTWYEVDVPKDYLNQEWQFGLGGPIVWDALRKNTFRENKPKP